MSEPLSSTEIEDVLSSIRRLVSDDLRPLHRSGRSGPMAAHDAPPAAGKLILTPALRVVAEIESPPPERSAPYRLHLGTPARTPSAGLDQVVASVGAAVDAQATEWEAETGDAAPFVAVPQHDDWQDTDAAAVVVYDGPAQPDDVQDVLHANVSGDEIVFQSSETSAQMPGWAQQESDMADDPEDTEAPTLNFGTIELDPAWADAAEASVIATLAADVIEDDPADTDTDTGTDYDDQPMVFDEDVLRELVRDILREELAGRMGERITRNIRKLVRAEIARSFATQKFE